MAETLDDIWKEYMDLCHAMQSGVATMMNYEPEATTPKHLRVGVNTALSDSGALAGILIRKGLITEVEYATAVRDKMREEVRRYQSEISAHMGGAEIHLG